jgi:mannose/cellobiose epimerase-like protein (N-acyl-D-glucosamine 2-epimerase family)
VAVGFSFSDTIAGYVISASEADSEVELRTTNGCLFNIHLTSNTFARFIYNLDEGYTDASPNIWSLLSRARQFVYAYGTFYPVNGSNPEQSRFEAQWLVFPGSGPGEYRHEEPNWWINQARCIGNSYLKWQFGYPGETIDFTKYRTILHLAGAKKGDFLQETDTISRLVYGLAATYNLTGEEQFLEGAEAGTQYLRDHMRFYDADEGLVYWYHGLKFTGDKVLKLLTSEFGDDYQSIPMYEQIYALAGPTMTYRLTGDPKIRCDIDKTLDLFEKYYKDDAGGGYFSHTDPISFNPRAESLGSNRARKNWNSVGDHAPAYLINLYLATGEQCHANFLEYTFDTICQHFPDYDNSPFVQERFHEDWTHDSKWGWQQDRAVVGHNLKIAWNLMRMNSLKPKDSYVNFARRIAEEMPRAGYDKQRTGWYDVVERSVRPNGETFRFVWHDRKAWWQQEQGILAYLILFGVLRDVEYLRLARESASFYNSFFLDHDDGGVYFNVLGNGLPYLVGNERLKGSHSMSAYHSLELCFLSAVYGNLLIAKEPMDFYFKPHPGGLVGNVLRVAPDLLPPGSIRIVECEIDGAPYLDFDAVKLTVNLPELAHRPRVRVRLGPANWMSRQVNGL